MFGSYDKTKVQRIEGNEPEKTDILDDPEFVLSKEDTERIIDNLKSAAGNSDWPEFFDLLFYMSLRDPDFSMDIGAIKNAEFETEIKSGSDDPGVIFSNLIASNHLKHFVWNNIPDNAGEIISASLWQDLKTGKSDGRFWPWIKLYLKKKNGFDIEIPKEDNELECLQKALGNFKEKKDWVKYLELAGGIRTLDPDQSLDLECIDWSEIRAKIEKLRASTIEYWDGETLLMMMAIEALKRTKKRRDGDPKVEPMPTARKF